MYKFIDANKKRLIYLSIFLVIAGSVIAVFVIARQPDDTPSTVGVRNNITPTKPKPEVEKQASIGFPGTVIDLTNWKLTLPTADSNGKPKEILQPQLDTYRLKPFFNLNETDDGVIFRANAGGATTKNSNYPRSELREMTNNGRSQAIWSNEDKTMNVMTIKQAITALPKQKPELVAGQIHDESDDIIMIRLENSRLFVEADGKEIGLLDSNYALGTVFITRIEAADGHIRVFYNNKQMVDYKKSGSDYYFKAGCYVQSNTDKGDAPESYGEVIIYDLQISHS